MPRPALLPSLLIAAALAAGVARAEPAQISWSDLAPPAPAIENPFEALSAEQLDALRTLLRHQAGASGITDAEADALRAGLAADGLDAEALFARRLEIMAERQAQATATNAALTGRDVRLPGYVLPLEIRDRRATEFLLVPTVGACVHTPPPPANQLVHVRYPEGVEVDGLFTPVWIEGPLAASFSEQAVRYSDGQGRVAVSYAMDAAAVEPY